MIIVLCALCELSLLYKCKVLKWKKAWAWEAWCWQPLPWLVQWSPWWSA